MGVVLLTHPRGRVAQIARDYHPRRTGHDRQARIGMPEGMKVRLWRNARPLARPSHSFVLGALSPRLSVKRQQQIAARLARAPERKQRHSFVGQYDVPSLAALALPYGHGPAIGIEVADLQSR